MSLNLQEVGLQHRFRPEGFDDHEKEVIVGALNKYGVERSTIATTKNLTAFTWEQVQSALLLSRKDCLGDSLDDLDDVLYAVRDERRIYDVH